MAQWAIDVFTDLIEVALPIAVVWEIGNLIVSTFLRAAFRGRLSFRGD